MLEYFYRLRDWYRKWDPWPLIRLITVLLIFGIRGYWNSGLHLTLGDICAIPMTFFLVFLLLGMICAVLAEIYLLLLAWLVFSPVFLNDWYYEATHWILRVILRIKSEKLLMALGLCGEIYLFSLTLHCLDLWIHRIF